VKKFKLKIKIFFNKFFPKEGKKTVINFKRISIFTALVVITLGSVFALFNGDQDSSSVAYSNEGVHQTQNKNKQKESPKGFIDKLLGKINNNQNNNDNNKGGHINRGNTVRKKNINYKAKQVINRSEDGKLKQGVPMGTHLIGKLLTTIDTRELGQMYKVLLPYGGRTRKSSSIPKNTILFGHAKYAGKGNKVFLEFTKALLPSGKEVKISAQAMNSKNYSPGLVGNFRGRRTERIVSTIGLTMVSAMTNTLTEKQAIGKGEVVTNKSNLKNSLYQGLSKISELEAGRQATKLNEATEYITVSAGKEMIINLLSVFHIE